MESPDNTAARLLLVDDEPFNLEILSEHLAEAGYEIETALDGEKAWAILTQDPTRFDAVLLDRMMPGINGMEVLKRMQAHAQLSLLPVVMQTAVGSPEAVREGMEAGAYYYLTKPFEQGILLAIVAAAVGQHRARCTAKQTGVQPLEALALLEEAQFSLRTLTDAQRVAALVGRMTPTPERVVLGLTELLVNGIEHGNLGVSYADKKSLMQAGMWRETIDAMQQQPQYCDKRVQVSVKRAADLITIVVTDEGAGFDWTPYLEFDPARAFDPNGRGISMARAMSFEAVTYQGAGNVVVATIRLSPANSNQ